MNISTFPRLVDVVLPAGGVVVALAEVYLDESGSHDGSPALTVAGHIYFENAAKSFDRAWADYLATKNLPYFRMSECAHRQGAFDGWTDDQCDVVERELIAQLRSRSERGIAVVVNEADFKKHAPKSNKVGNAYSFCLRSCLTLARDWIDESNFKGKVAYFFEAGHRHQAEANAIMNEIFGDEVIRDLYRYSAHAFVDKKLVRPLQGADLLAWQWFTNVKRKLSGARKSRADLIALMRDNDKIIEWTPDRLSGLTSYLEQIARARTEEERLAVPLPETPDQTPLGFGQPQSRGQS